MKITLDIKDGLQVKVRLHTEMDGNSLVQIGDGGSVSIRSAGDVQFVIEPEPEPEQAQDKPADKPMHAGGKSGVSGSLSFA